MDTHTLANDVEEDEYEGEVADLAVEEQEDEDEDEEDDGEDGWGLQREVDSDSYLFGWNIRKPAQ